MRKLISAVAVAGMAIGISSTVVAGSQEEMIKEGQSVFHTKSRGNCVACHDIPDPIKNQPGTQGPMIIAMKDRFPDKAVLRAQVWDASVKNPLTIMPPMGKNDNLTEEEIDAVVEYIYQY
jgi:sulfur-oxidizing protein SoxX